MLEVSPITLTRLVDGDTSKIQVAPYQYSISSLLLQNASFRAAIMLSLLQHFPIPTCFFVVLKFLSFGFHMQTDFPGYLCSFARGTSHQEQTQMSTPPLILGFLNTNAA